jgi:alpha,alpha-trehalose-phosphate synthase [UDP-forming]
MLRSRGGVWVCAEEADEHAEVPVEGPDLGYRVESVHLSRSEQRGFYGGISNAILWPLLHSFPPTSRVGEAPWPSYVSANRAFADGALAASHRNDTIWVHDYHLLLVPHLIRKRRASARVGWFCHVPWPSADLFGILPWRGEILRGLLGADVLAFHTEVFANNFLQCVERFGDASVDWVRRVVHGGDRQATRIRSSPIGVPVAELEELSGRSDLRAKADELRRLVGGRRIILGVDRLDYTKGIPERILAYEKYLLKHPKATEELVFVQVMVPSRTDVAAYAKLKDDVDRLVGAVNGRFSKTGRVAIHYLYQNLDRDMLFAHYLAADVALVTPLRDGMNLVAHEYVISRTKDDGVLVLSEFAGAAEYMKDAFLVNPYDLEGVAEAIEAALCIDKRTMRRRMRSIREEVRRLDVHKWADAFLEELEHGT